MSDEEKVTLLFADGDRNQCRVVHLYASCQESIELSAVASNGHELVDLVEHGLRPEVLVLDVLLPGPNLTRLLQQLAVLNYHPRIILTGLPYVRKLAERFLTMGANCIMVKPYTLEELFDEVYHQAAGSAEWAAYCVRSRFWELMNEMHYNRRLGGVQYLERIIQHTVLEPADYIAKELYLWAAGAEPVSVGTVISALQRVNDSLRRTGPDGYNELCCALGKPNGSHLTNLELIQALTEEIRRTVPVAQFKLDKEPIS